MSDFVTPVRDHLRGIGPFAVPAMFGGNGPHCRGPFPGRIAGDALCLCANVGARTR